MRRCCCLQLFECSLLYIISGLSASQAIVNKQSSLSTNTARSPAGHSLGGALAVLAAFQIQDQHRLPHICCYTYGAPRTGYASFADEYERLVPDTFHVINDR